MAGAALHHSSIRESIKSDYVHYVERYESGTGGGGTDSEGNPIPTYPLYDRENWTTHAMITGKVTSSSKMLVGGVPVAVVGDRTSEQWRAEPYPYPQHSTGSIESIYPGTSGSGSGTITSGSTKVFLAGNALALIGSSVKTHLDNQTVIADGSHKMNIL